MIVANSLDHLLEEAVKDVGRSTWAKKRELLTTPMDHGQSLLECSQGKTEDDSDPESSRSELWNHLQVERTFICSAAYTRNPASVNQSTTEANLRSGMNPRRAVASLDDL